MIINTVNWGGGEIEFNSCVLIHRDNNKMIFLIDSKDVPEDDSFIFDNSNDLQVIWGGGEDIHGCEIKDFYFTNELAGATSLEVFI